MFKKKAKIEDKKELQDLTEEVKEKEEELIEKTCPDAETAWIVVRDNVNHWIMGLCNLSKQDKKDISTCLEYLINYIDSHKELEAIQKQIDEKTLQEYSKSYEDNGYIININIKKKK